MTEETTRECDAAGLPDLLAELEREGWQVVAITKLPAAIGYRIRATRICSAR